VIGRLLRRTTRADELFAEAQALIDDGLELAFVLDLYPDDADWLAPLLDTGIVIGESFAVEEPSYYFEASLKNRFVEAGAERAARAAAPVSEPVAVVTSIPAAGGLLRLQGVMAGSAVAVVLGGLSVLTLGVVTSGDSVPGEWNYAFKLAGERIEYSLSSGDDRTNIQIRHTMVRIEEFQRLAQQGKVSEKNVEDLSEELEDLGELTSEKQLDPVQQANVKAASESAGAVLASAKESVPELSEQIDAASAKAASLGGAPTGVSAPSPTPTATSTATATATPSVTPTAEASASPSASPSPEASETPVPEDEEPAETADDPDPETPVDESDDLP
jgi:TolA-binding protein